MEDVVVAEFASPFKRRKAAAADLCKGADAAAPDCFASPPPAARKKLGRFFTPQGKGAAGPAAPATPGAERPATEARARDVFCPDGPAAEESLLSPEPCPLPPCLGVLRDLLGAIYATLPLVKARGQLTTFANLKGPVQNLGSRNIKVEHLQQIKALYPDAFTWQHVLVPVPGRSGRQEEQLMLGLTPPERLASAQQSQEQKQPEAPVTRRSTRSTPSKQGGSAAATPVKRAASLPSPGSAARSAAVGAAASVQGTMQQQREFLEALRSYAAKHKASGSKAVLSEADLPLAPLPAPAAPSVRDSTPARRQGSGSSAEGALPRTPQTGASSRPPMSPVDPGTPATGGTVRSLAFSPVASSKQPVPRFEAPAATAAGAAPSTPGTKRNALGLEIPRPSPRTAPAGDGFFSPRGRAGAGAAGIRPSRLCFDSLAPAAAAEEEAPKAAAPRPRRLSFDPPAGKAPAAAGDKKGDQEDKVEGAAPAPVPLSREGSGASGRQLSGGLQFELKASTMALLDRAASAQVRVEQARQAAELSARHHLDLAPSTFDILRGIFGAKGPCAMPREVLLGQLRDRTTSKTGLSADDAAEQLRLMLRLLPAWIRVDHPPGVSLADMRVVVRIHRRTPWGELRQQLLERVAIARTEAVPAVGADAEAAAAAEAADLTRAALDAAVARADAAAAAQAGDDSSDDSGAAAAEEEPEVPASSSGDDVRPQADACVSPSRAAAVGGKVEPEALSALLKARVWGAK